MIQDFSSDNLIQSPLAPIERNYYKFWFDVLSNKTLYSDILDVSPCAPDEYITQNIS